MLLVQDGDIRLFVMEQEAAGTAQTRMDFAFCLFRAGSSFGNSFGTFSFGALEW